jgi:hypothetical protein
MNVLELLDEIDQPDIAGIPNPNIDWFSTVFIDGKELKQAVVKSGVLYLYSEEAEQ